MVNQAIIIRTHHHCIPARAVADCFHCVKDILHDDFDKRFAYLTWRLQSSDIIESLLAGKHVLIHDYANHSTRIVDESDYVAADLYNNLACYKDEVGKDPDRRWTRIAEGLMAPHRLVGYQCDFMPLAYYRPSPVYPGGPESYNGGGRINAGLAFSPSIDVVITNDKSKWTKCSFYFIITIY